MIKGPVELVVLSFDGNQFRGEIVPAIKEAIEKDFIRIIDLVFIRKEANGDETITELEAMNNPIGEAFEPLVDMVTGLVSEEDLDLFAGLIANGSSAAVVLFEHLWAAKLSDAVIAAHGKIVANGHVPRSVIKDLIENYGNPEVVTK
jgi:uncharacterized protein DUF6325